jgi:flagellar hook protein FlgE
MPFRVALSGLNAAGQDLRITANNIANVNTTGFKRARAEFGDVFAVSAFGVANNAIGSGVALNRVSQQFTQGNVDFTQNSLDMAISGDGFFTLNDNGSTVYSRAGAFGVDREGFVVNAGGARLQVFPPVAGLPDRFDGGRLTDLQLATTDSAPSATTSAQIGLTLPANATVPTITPFSPTEPRSYNHSTSVTVFDSLGTSHVQTMYFVKTGTNQWNAHTYIDGAAVGGAQALTFDSQGVLTAPANGLITLPPHTPTSGTPPVANGAAPVVIALNLSATTQRGERFGVNSLTQDGYATGRLVGVSVSPEGVVAARYTNGQSTPLGQVVMTRFANPQGLQQLGDTSFSETTESGEAVRGEPGTSSFGVIQAGALEASNVDLTAELVNMITAQRNFQANAQMISTSDQIQQTIINIR